MKILLLADGIYPFVLGGMQKHSYSLAKYLSRSGHRIHLIHYYQEVPVSEPDSMEEFQDFNLGNITFTGIPFKQKNKLPGHYLRSNLAFSDSAWESLKNDIHDFDFIYAQGFTGNRFIHEKLKSSHQVPIGVNFHGFEMFQTAPDFKTKLQHLLFRSRVKWNCRNADFVLSYGGKISELILSLGIGKSKIIESPMGIDDTWLQNESVGIDVIPPRKFLFIGRYERRKGILVLNMAISELLKHESEKFEFHFIGPIPKEKQINSKSIFYHGKINKEKDIRSIVRKCDFLVCASYSEGMPTVILEGMAGGNAIIATDVGAVNMEVTDNGILLDAPKVELILHALKKGIDCSDAVLKTWKNNSLKNVKNNFKWSKVADDLIEKIKKATGNQ